MKYTIDHKLVGVKNQPIYGKGDYIGIIKAREGTYPDDGEYEGYWYIKIEQ